MAQDGAGNIRELLDKHGVKLTKALGQNFLIDANIPEKIVRLSGIDGSCGVLEVGPGIGPLTRELCKAAGQVTAVELDRRLIPILGETLAEFSNVTIVGGDILKLDIKKLVMEKMPGLRAHVAANLPYNITTPALTAFIEAGVFESVTVMVQKEVAKRICAKPGSSDYGAFTVFVNYHSEPVTLFDVPPECFLPRPGVTSSVVSLKMRGARILEPDDEQMFFRVVRAAFAQRRKTLVNALLASFGRELDKEAIARLTQECGFDVRVRGETLGISEFARISAAIQNYR